MATPDVGDSAVLELVGLGAAAAAGSPAVAAFVGGTMADARTTTEELDLVCAGRSTRLRMPVLDLRGTPLGVDARRVVELGITPKITTGVLHASAGVGQVGAGVGAGTGAVAAKVIDHGVSDEWVGWFRETVQTGTTTLVLLVEDLDRHALVTELQRFTGATLVYANLDADWVDRMRDALSR